jgi:hypothetical protein
MANGFVSIASLPSTGVDLDSPVITRMGRLACLGFARCDRSAAPLTPRPPARWGESTGASFAVELFAANESCDARERGWVNHFHHRLLG